MLLDDTKLQMCDTRGLDHPRCFQFNLLSANMLEQPSPFTEQYGHEVNLYFVKQSSLQKVFRLDLRKISWSR